MENFQVIQANHDIQLGTPDDVILVTFVVDKSGSIHNYVDDLNEAIKEGVSEWKKSHHSDKIYYSLIEFDDNIVVTHGFQPIENIAHKDISPGGTTALYDAMLIGVNNSEDYYKSILQSGGDCKCMIFCFTDGQDNASKAQPKDIKDKIKSIFSEEENYGNFDFILFGLGDSKYFQSVGDNTNFKVITDDPSDNAPLGKKIRNAVTVASQSVSSGKVQTNIVI